MPLNSFKSTTSSSTAASAGQPTYSEGLDVKGDAAGRVAGVKPVDVKSLVGRNTDF